MGTVWLATDQVLERQVAVKEVTFSVDLTDEERRSCASARCARPAPPPASTTRCVTTVYDVVEEDGKPWLVMEHVPSRSLQEIVEEQGPLPPAAVARIGLDVLDALEAAHDAGIVHRDVKPANVLVGTNGRACLTDFGIATTTGDSSLTTHGALIGSPSYMAPERANGEEPRPPGRPLVAGRDAVRGRRGPAAVRQRRAMATLMSVVSEHPAPMLRAGPLEPVLRGLLDKDPARRSTAEQARAPARRRSLAGPRRRRAAASPARRRASARAAGPLPRRLGASGSTPRTSGRWPRRPRPCSARWPATPATRPAPRRSATGERRGRGRPAARRPPAASPARRGAVDGSSAAGSSSRCWSPCRGRAAADRRGARPSPAVSGCSDRRQRRRGSRSASIRSAGDVVERRRPRAPGGPTAG